MILPLSLSPFFVKAEAPIDVEGLDSDKTAVLITDIITGEPIAAHNIDRPLIPASTTKTVTSAAVATLYSLESTYPTVIEIDGLDSDSTLNGNLIITSYGDPTLGSSLFNNTNVCQQIADSLNAQGINRISGRIIIDESFRINETAPHGWMDEDLNELYGALYQSTNYGSNKFVIRLPDETTSPITPDVSINWDKTKGRLNVVKSRHSNSFKASGRLSKNGSWSGAFPNSNAKATLIAEVESNLAKNGICVDNELIESNFQPRRLIAIHRSPTLAEIMGSMMFRSDNLLAEATLRLLSPQGTLKDAIKAERNTLAQIGVVAKNAKINDGSGLSRENRMSAHFLSDVLTRMAISENCIPYVGLFPKVGRDGTVRNLLRDTQLSGRLALKSGSMRGVLCYAGYRLDDEGLPSHTIVIMVNDFKGDRTALKKVIEELLIQAFSNLA